MTGKCINLYLIDGDVTGRIKCSLANWTGIAYKIPREDLNKCKDRDDLKQSGVYFLFGTSDETSKNSVYIGQAGTRKNGEGILYRLLEHKRNPDKDYWNEAIVFTTSNNHFGPTEISYLEHRFCNLAIEANRYEVKNGNEPSVGNITEEKESELEEFIEYAKLIMGTLNHKVFVPLVSRNQNDTPINADNILYLKRTCKTKSNVAITAMGKITREGFVLLKDSQIEPVDSKSIPTSIKKLRHYANISHGILQDDILFHSPSYAAAFVVGGHVNGLTYWKTKDGKTLKKLEEE